MDEVITTPGLLECTLCTLLIFTQFTVNKAIIKKYSLCTILCKLSRMSSNYLSQSPQTVVTEYSGFGNSSVEKGIFFSFTSQSPRLRRDGIILRVCSETIYDLLEEGWQKAAPRIKPKWGFSPCEVQPTHVETKQSSFMSLITVSTPEWYFGLDSK